jgi:Dip2/Utp12 Family
VADLPANALEQFVHTLVDKMTNDPNNSKHAVRWLKLTVKMNMAVLMSLPDALGALRGCQAFIRKKETMLPTVMRMKGKIELALTIRRQKRDMHKEALDIEGMKPLVTIRGGEIVQPQDGEAEDDNDDLDDELADDGIDDELDDELDDDEKLYQEAYENEELDEDLGGEEEDLEGLEDDED